MAASTAGDPQDSVTLVSLKIVDSDLNKTLSSIRLVKSELASIGAAQASSGAQVVNNLNAQANALKNAATNAQAYSGALAQARANANAFPQGQVGQGSDLGSSGPLDLGRIGSELRKLPSLQIPGTGVGTDAVANFIRLGGAAQGLGVALGTLLPVVGLVVAAVGAVALAFKAFNDGLEASRKTLAQALDAQDKYYDALKSGTTASVEGQIDTMKRGQEAIAAQIAENQNAINRARQNVSNDTGLGPIGDIFANIATSQLRDKVASLTDEYNANEQSVGRLTEGVKEGTFAINDRIEAEKKLAEANRSFQEQTFDLAASSSDSLRKRIADLLNDQQLNIAESNDPNTSADRQRALVGTPGTTDSGIIGASSSLIQIAQSFLQVQERADAASDSIKYQSQSSQQLQSLLDKTTEDYNHQQATLSGLKASGLAGDGTIKLLNDSIAKDAALVADLTSKYIPLAVARENEIEAAKNLKKAEEDRAKFQQEAAQIANDALRRIGEINTEEGEKETEALVKKNEDQTAAQKKADDALKKLAKDAADKRLEIERDFAREGKQAEQARDAVAFDAAKTKRDDDLTDLRTSTKRQRDEIRKSLKEQQQAIDTAYDKQITALKTAQAKQIASVQDAARRETDLKQQALNDQLTALNVFAPAAVGAFNGTLNTMLNSAKYLKAQVDAILKPPTDNTQNPYPHTPAGLTAAQLAAVQAAAAADSAGPATLNFQGNTYIPNPAYSRALPSHELGLDKVPYDGYIASLHKDELIATAAEARGIRAARKLPYGSRAGSGDIIIPISGVGRSKRQLMRLIEDKIDRIYDNV